MNIILHLGLLLHENRLWRWTLNMRFNSNRFYSCIWLQALLIIVKSQYLLKSKEVQLIQLYKCFCTTSCIKASFSSFLCWARKSFCWLNAPCQRLLFSHLPPTLQTQHPSVEEKKKKIPPTPVDELCLCVRLRQGNNTCLYTTEARSQNSRFLTWVLVNEDGLSQTQQRSLWPN